MRVPLSPSRSFKSIKNGTQNFEAHRWLSVSFSEVFKDVARSKIELISRLPHRQRDIPIFLCILVSLLNVGRCSITNDS